MVIYQFNYGEFKNTALYTKYVSSTLKEMIVTRREIFLEIDKYNALKYTMGYIKPNKNKYEKEMYDSFTELLGEYKFYYEQRDQYFERWKSQIRANIKADYFRIREEIPDNERILIKNMRFYANELRKILKNLHEDEFGSHNIHKLNELECYNETRVMQ